MWHTVLLLLILLIVTLGGVHLQNREPGVDKIVPEHHAVIPLYVSLIIFEWLLPLFVLFGIRRNGFRLRDHDQCLWDSLRAACILAKKFKTG